jgi:hypothetical protein
MYVIFCVRLGRTQKKHKKIYTIEKGKFDLQKC